MAELWGEELSQQNISYFCKKLGITRKKTYGYLERNEEERTIFQEKLEKIEESSRIYVDEAGFDNREDYAYGYSPILRKMSSSQVWKKTRKSQLD